MENTMTKFLKNAYNFRRKGLSHGFVTCNVSENLLEKAIFWIIVNSFFCLVKTKETGLTTFCCFCYKLWTCFRYFLSVFIATLNMLFFFRKPILMQHAVDKFVQSCVSVFPCVSCIIILRSKWLEGVTNSKC